MVVIVQLGRLGSVAALTGGPAPRERFVTWRFAEPVMLLDHHHGEPLAVMARHWQDDGTVSAEFDPFDAAEIQRLAKQSRSLSIEFSSAKELRPDATLDGGSCLEHRGAVIHAVAFAPDPMRGDARILTLPTPEKTQVRAATPAPAGTESWPAEVRRRYLAPNGQMRAIHGRYGGTVTLR